MSMAGSLGSRSSFSGASMMERNAQTEIAMRARGSVGNLMCGDCGAARTEAKLSAKSSAAHAAARVPTKVRRLMDTAYPPNDRNENIRFRESARESAQV